MRAVRAGVPAKSPTQVQTPGAASQPPSHPGPEIRVPSSPLPRSSPLEVIRILQPGGLCEAVTSQGRRKRRRRQLPAAISHLEAESRVSTGWPRGAGRGHPATLGGRWLLPTLLAAPGQGMVLRNTPQLHCSPHPETPRCCPGPHHLNPHGPAAHGWHSPHPRVLHTSPQHRPCGTCKVSRPQGILAPVSSRQSQQRPTLP